LERLAIRVSDVTVLRRIKAASGTPPDEVRNLGVDDWAWRKGQDYGTILVDLDRHQVVDLLVDRSSETFRTWLEHNPAVGLIARDRSGAYAEAHRSALPKRNKWRIVFICCLISRQLLNEPSKNEVVSYCFRLQLHQKTSIGLRARFHAVSVRPPCTNYGSFSGDSAGSSVTNR
jgi:transposase